MTVRCAVRPRVSGSPWARLRRCPRRLVLTSTTRKAAATTSITSVSNQCAAGLAKRRGRRCHPLWHADAARHRPPEADGVWAWHCQPAEGSDDEPSEENANYEKRARKPSCQSAWRNAGGLGTLSTGPSAPKLEVAARHRMVSYFAAGWSSQVARWAHNPEVAGSNPAPATKSS